MIISTYCCVSTAPYSVLNCCDVIVLWKDMIDWSRWRISWLAVNDTLSSIFEYCIYRHSHFHLIHLTTCSNTKSQTYTHNTHTTINFKDCPYVGSFRAGVLFLRISHVQISGKVKWSELNWGLMDFSFSKLDEVFAGLWCDTVWCGVVWCGVVYYEFSWWPDSRWRSNLRGKKTGKFKSSGLVSQEEY